MSGPATLEQIQREFSGAVLKEHATETELARLLESKLPPIRCVANDWFVYRNGVWAKTARIEFAGVAVSIQDPRTRTARKATEILKHVEFASQTNGKEFRSFHYCNQKGEIVINCANCVLVVSPHGMRALSHSESYYLAGQMAASYRPDAQAPNFESTVQFSLPDAADVELLRCFSGYILMPDCRHTAVSQLVDFQGAKDEHHLNEQRGKSTNWPWPEGLA